MKRQILISAVSIFIFVQIAGIWIAESYAAEKLDLKLRLKPGQKYSMRITTEQKISQTIGGKQQDINHMKATGVSFEVKEVDADGIASIKVTYLTLKEKTTSAVGQIEYDSTDPCTAATLDNPLAWMYKPMMGQSFTIKVTPKGEIVELEGIGEMFSRMAEKIIVAEDKLIKKTIRERREEQAEERAKRTIERINKRYGSREKRKQALKEMIKNNPPFAEEQIKELVGNMIMPFPGRPVGIGDSWEAKMIPPVVLPVEIDSTYTLKGSEKGVVVVDVISKMDLDDKAIVTKKHPPQQMDVKTTGTGSYQGTIQIDGTSGWVIRKKVNMRFSGEVTQQGTTIPMSIESVITVEPIE